jgi:DNA-binding transcriptional regulator YdaS (Cro superfamily)
MTQSPADDLLSGSLTPSYTPLPGGNAIFLPKSASSNLTPLVCDERAIARLLGLLLSRGGLSIGEVARRLGVTPQAVRQYLRGRRNKPSLIWFVKFAEACGGKVSIEFPK